LLPFQRRFAASPVPPEKAAGLRDSLLDSFYHLRPYDPNFGHLLEKNCWPSESRAAIITMSPAGCRDPPSSAPFSPPPLAQRLFPPRRWTRPRRGPHRHRVLPASGPAGGRFWTSSSLESDCRHHVRQLRWIRVWPGRPCVR